MACTVARLVNIVVSLESTGANLANMKETLEICLGLVEETARLVSSVVRLASMMVTELCILVTRANRMAMMASTLDSLASRLVIWRCSLDL
jgi:hypothetical protein